MTESSQPQSTRAVPSGPAGHRASPFEAAQRRQFIWITAAALGIFFALRALPTGTNLSHMDFRVDPKAGKAIEFCDPLNPQFIPVIAVRSPVTMTLTSTDAPVVGREVAAVLTLRTGAGRPIAPSDLVVTHTRKLHLLVVDPTLSDYQHVHPQPARTPGEWQFTFTPHRSGTYRVFGDFTPVATGRGLYASADLEVAESGIERSKTDVSAAASGASKLEREGFQFQLVTAAEGVRAGEAIALRFSAARRDGGAVTLEPVMGAFAHLVAFDRGRTGFAHLHPVETDPSWRPDPNQPEMNFKLTIPKAGDYVVWAQIKLGGEERFLSYPLKVVD